MFISHIVHRNSLYAVWGNSVSEKSIIKQFEEQIGFSTSSQACDDFYHAVVARASEFVEIIVSFDFHGSSLFRATSTKTGKITLFCGCKGALIFWFLRAERKKLPQKRVKLPFFVEVGYFFLLRGSLKRLFCGSLKRSSCGACRRAAAFLFYSCWCGGEAQS
ncbi:MAG: hypothetical protein SOZ67_00260 [Alloprevotella sp.]|nr:hypothetical protein [Alloprevotella sp.]